MSAGQQQKILLVEDEALIAMAQKMTLEKHGYVVLTASSGEKAVATVDAVPDIDLVLMDINLGNGMDGTEAATRILEKHDLALAFLSSHTEREVVEKTEGITSYGYIVKNSGEMVLIASIHMAFKLHEAQQRIQAQRMDIEAAYEEMQVANEELLNSQQDLIEHERALQTEQTFTEALLESLPGYLYVYDEQGNLIRWNKKHETMTGYSAEELSHMNMSDWYEGEDAIRVAEAIAEVFRTGYGEVEANLLLKNGKKILVLSNGVRLTIGEKSYFTGVGINITERKQNEQKIQDQLDELRRWYAATLDREDRIMSLKREVNTLLATTGQAPRYPSALE